MVLQGKRCNKRTYAAGPSRSRAGQSNWTPNPSVIPLLTVWLPKVALALLTRCSRRPSLAVHGD